MHVVDEVSRLQVERSRLVGSTYLGIEDDSPHDLRMTLLIRGLLNIYGYIHRQKQFAKGFLLKACELNIAWMVRFLVPG